MLSIVHAFARPAAASRERPAVVRRKRFAVAPRKRLSAALFVVLAGLATSHPAEVFARSAPESFADLA